MAKTKNTSKKVTKKTTKKEYNSADKRAFRETDEWKEFDIDKCIVIDDFETNVYGEYDFIDENFGWFLSNDEAGKFNIMMSGIERAVRLVGENVKQLGQLAQGKINLWDKDYTKIVETISFDKTSFQTAASMSKKPRI